MATIFHVALASDWAAAGAEGAYTVSTRGRSLADVGFIHASRGDQWPTIRRLFYSDVAEPLVLLRIDTDRLDVPVVEEPGEPGGSETFPHIYGPLPVSAVVEAIPLDGAGPPPTEAPTGSPRSFGSIFLREMFGNVALVCLVLVTTTLGVLSGQAVGDDTTGLAGAGLGLAAGAVAARLLYVRRQTS